MPELPEVEVSKMGITPHVIQQKIDGIIIRQPQLRWRIPEQLKQLQGQTVLSVERRAKYLLIRVDLGIIIIHLGMSGSLRVLDRDTPAEKHDHVDLLLFNGKLLRYNDPRRFGAWLWQRKGQELTVLQRQGIEPLDDAFNVQYLQQRLARKRIPIKQAIMDSHIVVGVGNIYATEALFSAKIDPRRSANQITEDELSVLIAHIKSVLATAIQQGGTTLKDFTQADGKPGYFEQELQVYGKVGAACPICQTELRMVKLGQRSSVYCPHCQK